MAHELTRGDSIRALGSGGIPVDASVMRFEESVNYPLTQQVHYRLYAGEHSFGYALSNAALLSTPREILAKAITKELVELLLDTMRKGDPS